MTLSYHMSLLYPFVASPETTAVDDFLVEDRDNEKTMVVQKPRGFFPVPGPLVAITRRRTFWIPWNRMGNSGLQVW